NSFITAYKIGLPDGNFICFNNLQIFPATHVKDGETLMLTPQYCRETGGTYSAEWRIDVLLTTGDCNGKILDRKNNIKIAEIPIMLKSMVCYLRDKKPEELMSYGED